MSDLIVDIAIGVSVAKTFHYRAPLSLKDLLVPGSRVTVPFGSRTLTGTVLGFADRTDVRDLKAIIALIDAPLSPALLSLGRWMADYYLHPIGLTLETMVPKAIGRTKPKKLKYLRLATNPPAGSLPPKGKKQRELIELIAGQAEIAVDALEGFGSSTIGSLIEAGILDLVLREGAPSSLQARQTSGLSTPPVLMPAQQDAVSQIAEAVSREAFDVFLIHGVTGSGKTEVYLNAIARLSDTGKGSIVLVPEIALTPQLAGRFRGRFGDRVAVLHSGLTDRERADEYRRIQAGDVDVAVGARSAVFAPFAHVGLIVVDEEHENSYKQDEGLRYHGRDVAVMRAKFENAVAVLGSATPSLESFYNGQSGRYRYVRLADRVDHRPLPAVTIVDLKTCPRESRYAPLLIEHITRRLEKREQTLLLLNRRGFSSVLLCRDCGAALRCPGCSVSLTFHKSDRTVKCHYCGHVAEPPERCPACSGPELKMIGTGTQKLEEELQALFPAARISRMDSDTVKGRREYETLLQKVDRREVDILLGTQMVAKGHDFPGVTLVGVIDADVGLNLPDFRSAEKTFQLVTQAAGRAGRGDLGGEVIIQTMNPGHYSVLHSRTHDYEGFYKEEMMYRAQLGYPPLGRMVKIEFRSSSEPLAKQAATDAASRIRSLVRDRKTMLLGPAAAPIAKVRGQFRFHLLLLARERTAIRGLAADAQRTIEEKFGRKCRVLVDVDPVNLM